jgi:hypothetical protein
MADWGFVEGVQRMDTYGEAAGSSAGTAITSPGASLNSKGAYTELASSTPFEAAGLIITGSFSASGAVSILVDIAIGAAGSEQVIIPNMHVFRAGSANTAITPAFFPIAIPAGSRISARFQHNSNNAPALHLSVVLLGATVNYPILGGQVATYGADTSTSKGAVVDPGGSANTKGSYTEITSATSIKSNWLVLSAIPDSAILTSTWLLDLAVGAVGSEQVILPDLHLFGSAGIGLEQMRFFLPIALPSGVRLAARAQCSSTAAGRNLAVTVHAIG